MILRILLLLTIITTACFGKPSINFNEELSILKELKNESIITRQRFDKLVSDIQSKNPITTSKTLGGTASINGHIENVSGTALELQNIQLHEIITGTQTQIANTTTDIGGNFSFSGLNAGTYLVYQGNYDDIYLNYMWDSISNVVCTVYRGVCRTPDVSNHIVISNAEVRNGIDFIPIVGGIINGSVTDAITNSGVNTLILNLESDSAVDYKTSATIDAVTGAFSIKGIPDGNYHLFTSDSLSGDNIHISQIFGGPECNLCNRVLASNTSVGTQLSITSASTINNIDFSLNIGASISGKLIDAITLNPTPNYAIITLFGDLNQPLGYQVIYGTDIDPTIDGSYFLGGLLPGNYYVQGDGRAYYQRELYSNKPCYWAGCYRNTGDLVSLAPLENKVNINFLLEKGGLISGTIIDQSTGQSIIGATGPATQAMVEIIDAAGNVVGGATVENDGSYITTKGLPPGTYSVRTGSMFQGELTQPYINEKYNDVPCAGIACDFTSPNVTVIANTTTFGIDFELTTGNSFTGTVTDITTSAPIGGVHVLVYSDMGMGVVKFANWTTTSRGDIPGGPAIGTFEVSGLPDGTYYARTGYGSDLPFFVSSFYNIGGAAPVGWIDILYDNLPCLASCDVTLGTPIVLPVVVTNKSSSSALATPIINFGLTQGAVITGQVNDFIQNAPIKDVTVNVYNDQGTFMGSSITNDLGEYITRGLPDGTYYLTTSTGNVLLDVKYGNEFCIQGNCDPLDALPITVTGSINATNRNFILKTTYMHMFSNDFE